MKNLKVDCQILFLWTELYWSKWSFIVVTVICCHYLNNLSQGTLEEPPSEVSDVCGGAAAGGHVSVSLTQTHTEQQQLFTNLLRVHHERQVWRLNLRQSSDDTSKRATTANDGDKWSMENSLWPFVCFINLQFIFTITASSFLKILFFVQWGFFFLLQLLLKFFGTGWYEVHPLHWHFLIKEILNLDDFAHGTVAAVFF